MGVHFTCGHAPYTWACVYLVGVHLISKHPLIGVHLAGVHLTGVHLTGIHLAGVHLIGVHLTHRRASHSQACISQACISLIGVHLDSRLYLDSLLFLDAEDLFRLQVRPNSISSDEILASRKPVLTPGVARSQLQRVLAT
jgi:hypothetical protein